MIERARGLGARAAVVLAWLALGGCGGAAGAATSGEAAPPAQKQARAKSDFDPCEGQGPPAKAYAGVLRQARCDQDLFLTMAGVADALGTTCAHCHVPKPGGGPNDFDFPVMTPRKEVANWMQHELVDKLRHRDGSPVRCDSCHVGKDGKRRAKFLGEPRDARWAMEWMSLVMVNEFTLEGGGKLRCKHCHGAPPGGPGFRKEVIGRELAELPRRRDLPPRELPPAAPADAAPAGPPADVAPPAPASSAGPAPAASPAGSDAPPKAPPPPGPGASPAP